MIARTVFDRFAGPLACQQYLDPQSGWLFKWRGDMKKFQRFIPPLPQPKPAVSSKRKEKSGKSETAPKKRLKVPSTATKKSSDNSAGGVVKVSVITPGSAEPKIVEQRVITSEPTSELVTPSTRTLKGVKGAEQSKLITKWNSLQQSEQTSDKKPICYVRDWKHSLLINGSQCILQLCKRKFGSMELLKKHEKLSDLHKVRGIGCLSSLFSRPHFVWSLGDLKKNLEKKKQEVRGLLPVPTSTLLEVAAQDANYRDRAAERRAITAPSESEIELRQREQQLEAEARSVAEVSEGSEGNVSRSHISRFHSFTPSFSQREEAKSEENIGSKLLKAMGWDGKSGLGRENQGIVAPVDAVETLGGKAMNDSTGLGALPKGTVVPGGNIQANKAAQRLKVSGWIIPLWVIGFVFFSVAPFRLWKDTNLWKKKPNRQTFYFDVSYQWKWYINLFAEDATRYPSFSMPTEIAKMLCLAMPHIGPWQVLK